MGVLGRGRADVLIDVAGALLVAAFLVAVALWTDDLLGVARDHGLLPTLPAPTDRI